jgi:hypothetical protein
MPDDSKRDLGPNASIRRALLNPEQIELFDWFTSKLAGPESDANFFGSMLQAVACRYPKISYWSAVKVARDITNRTPDFDKVRLAALKKADVDLAKPTDS